MNIHQIEQRILINELMNKQAVPKKELADALIKNGHCGLDPLPVKNTVRMNMIILQRKFTEIGFPLWKVDWSTGGVIYEITSEAIKYIGFNFAVPQYDETGDMIGQLYQYPPFKNEEE